MLHCGRSTELPQHITKTQPRRTIQAEKFLVSTISVVEMTVIQCFPLSKGRKIYIYIYINTRYNITDTVLYVKKYLVGRVVQVALRIWGFVVGSGGDGAGFQGFHARHGLEAARCTQRVARASLCM